MPTTEQILNSLIEIANTWRALAAFWHAYFAAVAVVLIFGVRFSKHLAGILLLLPLISVSVIAWLYMNPFNGLIFALISSLVLYFSLRMPREKIQIAPLWKVIPGIFLFLFGWIYPHFISNTSSFLFYVWSTPIGLIPCPTLSVVIGLALILNGLNSRALLLTLGIPGLFYGITGVFQLGVTIDWILLFGALMIVILAFTQNHPMRTHTE